MGADVVLLFVLVWTFTAVCQDFGGDISVICENVTGTVGEEVTLTCSVSMSLKCSERCITLYRFYYPENYKDSVICREEFPRDPCEQRNSFTCRFTPTTATTEQFRFFVQTLCGRKTTEFTVSITELIIAIKPEHDTEDPHLTDDYEDPGKKDHRFMARIITGACVIGFIVIIIVVIAIVCVKRFRRNNPSGVQVKYERGASAEPTITAEHVQSETK